MSLERVMKKRLAGKKFYRYEFSKDPHMQDLRGADLRGISAIECDFSGVDLSESLMSEGNFYGSKFEDTNLSHADISNAIMANTVMKPRDAFDMTLTLNCASFDGMKTDNSHFLGFINFALMMHIDDTALKNRIIEAIGAETYVAVQRMFRGRT